MTIKLKWVTPPGRTTGQQAARAHIAEELKQQPGMWALVETDVAASTRKSWQRLGCEATTRRRVEGGGSTAFTHDVYARWPKPTPSTSKTRVKGTPGIAPPLRESDYLAGGYLAGRTARNIPTEGKKR